MARRMMKVQMDHALSRLDEAFHEKLGPKPKVSSDNTLQRNHLALIKKGKVKVTPTIVKRAITATEQELRRDGSRYCHGFGYHLSREVDVELEKVYTPKDDPALVAWQARYKKLSAEYNRIKDEIILGDVERALELIAEFQSFTV